MNKQQTIDDLLWFIRWKQAAHYWFNVSPSREEFKIAKEKSEIYEQKIQPLLLDHIASADDNVLYESRWGDRT